MLMRLENRWLLDDLCSHYTRSGFEVQRVGGSMIEVRRSSARDEHEERRMIEMHADDRGWPAREKRSELRDFHASSGRGRS